MNPLLVALQAAGLLDADDAEQLNRLLDNEVARAWTEQQLASVLGSSLNAQQSRLIEALTNGGPNALVADALWSDEDRRLYDALMPTLRTVTSERAILLATQLGGEDMWQRTNEALVQWVDRYYSSTAADAFGAIPNLNATARQEIGALVNAWERGELAGRQVGLPQLIAEMENTFGPARGARIAVTETTRIFAESTRYAAQASPNVTKLRWLTGADEFVCFPAGTMVSTPLGEMPIEHVVPGQLVLTRQGNKRVRAVSKRRYSGPMTQIDTASGVSLTCTANHRLWSEGKQAWLEAAHFQSGDAVQLVGHKRDDVRGILNFRLGHSNQRPPLSGKVPIFGRVAFWRMPVVAVNFDSDHLVRNGEVNAIATDTIFLGERDAGSSQRLTNARLKQGFGLRTAIASERTELSVSVSRLNANALAASLAFHVGRWATAFLGAEPLNPSAFARLENFAATFAYPRGTPIATFPTANCISVSHRRADRKLLVTDRTSLGDHLDGVGRRVTLASTESSLGMKLRPGEWFPATLTQSLGGGALGVIARLRTILLSCLGWRRLEGLVTADASTYFHRIPRVSGARPSPVLYHELPVTTIDVYDLEVDGAHEFYANGILVHNCKICGPLHGQVVDKGGTFPGGLMPPAHVNCRCRVTPETDLSATVELGAGNANAPWAYTPPVVEAPAKVSAPPVVVRAADLQAKYAASVAERAAIDTQQVGNNEELYRLQDKIDKIDKRLAGGRLDDTRRFDLSIERASYVARQQALHDANDALWAQWQAIRTQSRQDIHRAILADTSATPLQLTLQNGNVNGRSIDEAQNFLSRLTSSKSINIPRNTIPIVEVSGRPYSGNGWIYVTGSSQSRTIVHEVGHVIEFHNPAIRERAAAWRDARTAGEELTPLGGISNEESQPGGVTTGYNPNELTRRDKFISPYIGKEYAGGATEVLSMGLEMMFHDPASFLQLDPGMFDFILDLMQGD